MPKSRTNRPTLPSLVSQLCPQSQNFVTPTRRLTVQIRNLPHLPYLKQTPSGLWPDQSMDGSPLMALAIMGINRPSDCSPRFNADCLYHEFGFPSRDVYNVHYLGEGLSELIVPTSSIPSLQCALAGSSVELCTKFDPTVPLTRGLSAKKACSLLNHRITSTINRIKTGPKTPRMSKLVNFLET